MRNISTWKDFNDYWKHKNHLQTSSGAGLQSTGPMGGGEAKVVCFFKEDIIEKLFLYHTVSIVVMPPTPPPPPPQPLYEFRQQRGRRQVPVLLKGISRQLLRPSKQSCWRGGVGDRGWEVGKDPIVFQMTEQGFIYQLAFLYMKKKSNNSPNPSIGNNQLSGE